MWEIGENMSNYVLGFLWLFVMIFFIYGLGAAITKEDTFMPDRLIVGYIGYSFIIALFGIPIQVFNAPWKLFFICMIILWIVSICFIVYRFRKYSIQMFPNGFLACLKDNYFLIVITCLLIVLMLSNFRPWWFNNHLDDGYYLNKVMELPYVTNPYRHNYATGFTDHNYSGSYWLATHESELSVYAYVFHAFPSLFCRLFVSGYHYYLLVNLVTVAAKKIADGYKKSYKQSSLQYACSIVLLFSMYEVFLFYKGWIRLGDWDQYTYAMYYGSSIPRVMGMLLLIGPFIDRKKIDIRLVTEVLVISIVLISKSAIAIPIILASVITYLLGYFICIQKKYKSSLIFILALAGLGIILNRGDILRITQFANHVFTTNIILFMILLIGILILWYREKKALNKEAYFLNTMLIIMTLLVFVPWIGNIISSVCFFPFVRGRLILNLFYSLTITIIIELYCTMILNKRKQRTGTILSTALAGALFVSSLFSIQQAGGSLFYQPDTSMISLNLLESYRVFKQNPMLMPKSTIELGEKLQEYTKKHNKELNILSSDLQLVNGVAYALAIQLDGVAYHNTHVISALYRYSNPQTTVFKDYSSNRNFQIYYNFMATNDEKSFKEFQNLLRKYPINCLITANDVYTEKLSSIGFKEYASVVDNDAEISYYIYIK